MLNICKVCNDHVANYDVKLKNGTWIHLCNDCIKEYPREKIDTVLGAYNTQVQLPPVVN